MLNEATTDGTIESLLDVTKLAANNGVFNDQLIKDVRLDFISGIKGSLSTEFQKISKNNQQELKKLLGFLITPIEKANTISDFISGLSKLVVVKKSLFKRFGIQENINENINFGKFVSILKTTLRKSKSEINAWWAKNQNYVRKIIATILINFVIKTLIILSNTL